MTRASRPFDGMRLLGEAWRRIGRVSAYEGMYVALAVRLACPLLTADSNLARTPGLGVTTTLLDPGR